MYSIVNICGDLQHKTLQDRKSYHAQVSPEQKSKTERRLTAKTSLGDVCYRFKSYLSLSRVAQWQSNIIECLLKSTKNSQRWLTAIDFGLKLRV